jgi:hypothetical protein
MAHLYNNLPSAELDALYTILSSLKIDRTAVQLYW